VMSNDRERRSVADLTRGDWIDLFDSMLVGSLPSHPEIYELRRIVLAYLDSDRKAVIEALRELVEAQDLKTSTFTQDANIENRLVAAWVQVRALTQETK
jgi:hypothetical protein